MNELGISEEVVNLVNEAETECYEEFLKIDKRCDNNSLKVLSSFQRNEVTESCFNETTGYGYNDLGRDTIEFDLELFPLPALGILCFILNLFLESIKLFFVKFPPL